MALLGTGPLHLHGALGGQPSRVLCGSRKWIALGLHDDRVLTSGTWVDLGSAQDPRVELVERRAFPFGGNFPDSLAVSPIAAMGERPLYLIPASVAGAPLLTAVVKRAVILGSEGAVSAKVEASLKSKLGSSNVVRLGGRDRYETAVSIATYGAKSVGLSWDGVAVATGLDFPDALGGGVLQGKTGSVMLLSDPKTLSGVPVRSTDYQSKGTVRQSTSV